MTDKGRPLEQPRDDLPEAHSKPLPAGLPAGSETDEVAEADQVDQEDDEARWAAYMRAAQAGDQRAFEMLLEEILPRLRAHVFARLAGREYAEDVVQNILLSIHRSRHTYHPTRPFKPWLNAVMRNAVIDAVRARRNDWRNKGFDELEIAAAPVEEPIPGGLDALSPELQAALSQLPATQREAVELLHLKELSVREAASRSGASMGAIKVRAHRGRARLREILTGLPGRKS